MVTAAVLLDQTPMIASSLEGAEIKLQEARKSTEAENRREAVGEAEARKEDQRQDQKQ